MDEQTYANLIGFIPIAIIVAIVIFSFWFPYKFGESGGVLGFLANLVEYIRHKFWKIVIIGILLFAVFFAICNGTFGSFSFGT